MNEKQTQRERVSECYEREQDTFLVTNTYA